MWCRAGCAWLRGCAGGLPLEPLADGVRNRDPLPSATVPRAPCDDPGPPCLLVETATVVPAAGAGGVTTMAWLTFGGGVGVAVTTPYCAVGGGGAAFTWMIASTAQPGNESTLPPPTALSATAASAP